MQSPRLADQTKSSGSWRDVGSRLPPGSGIPSLIDTLTAQERRRPQSEAATSRARWIGQSTITPFTNRDLTLLSNGD